jgi:hypothetical protein
MSRAMCCNSCPKCLDGSVECAPHLQGIQVEAAPAALASCQWVQVARKVAGRPLQAAVGLGHLL